MQKTHLGRWLLVLLVFLPVAPLGMGVERLLSWTASLWAPEGPAWLEVDLEEREECHTIDPWVDESWPGPMRVLGEPVPVVDMDVRDWDMSGYDPSWVHVTPEGMSRLLEVLGLDPSTARDVDHVVLYTTTPYPDEVPLQDLRAFSVYRYETHPEWMPRPGRWHRAWTRAGEGFVELPGLFASVDYGSFCGPGGQVYRALTGWPEADDGLYLMVIPDEEVEREALGVGHNLILERRLHDDPDWRWASRWTPPSLAESLGTSAGSLLNILAGTLGLLWLIRIRRRSSTWEGLDLRAWLATLLALTWGRPALYGLLKALGTWKEGHWDPFLDTDWLAIRLDLPLPTITMLLCALGLVACITVIRLAPRPLRIPLLVGGPSAVVLGGMLYLTLL